MGPMNHVLDGDPNLPPKWALLRTNSGLFAVDKFNIIRKEAALGLSAKSLLTFRRKLNAHLFRQPYSLFCDCLSFALVDLAVVFT